MSKSYKQLLQSEREAIQLFLKLNQSHNAIAKQLNRNQATITREINRNSVGGVYRVKIANNLTRDRRIKANHNQTKITSGSKLEEYIIDKITNHNWSPEQITGRIKLDWGELDLEHTISHESIYSWIYRLTDLELKNKITIKLRYNKGKYRRRHGTRLRRKESEELKKNRIDKRPEIVETRQRLGDWEGDTIVGGERTIHILTHVDRRSGYLMADKLEQATAEQTQLKTLSKFRLLPQDKKQTITYDNGVQFSLHQGTEEKTGIPIYFAFPYHSWERGTNENTNGLLRQYYPKGSMFKDITQEDLDQTVDMINNRPRKRLNYRTPKEVFALGMKF
jgi:IS30 family transposase